MAEDATIPVNDDGTIDRIVVGGVEHMFKLTVNEESLAAVSAATEAANTAAAAASDAAESVRREAQETSDSLRAQVLDVLGFLSVNEAGQVCITHTVEEG